MRLKSKRLIAKLKRGLGLEPYVTKGTLLDDDLVSCIGRDDPILLEIGCNDGEDTLRFLKLFPQAQMFCFEPDPRARKRFRDKVQDERVQLFELAISNHDGMTEFFASDGVPSEELAEKMPDGWDLSGSIQRPKNHLERHPWCRFDDTIQVETLKLDTWARQQSLDRIDFIWADVQGAEKQLIEGGIETLKRTRFFYTEYSDQELYEGQLDFGQLTKLLPDFQVVYRYAHDVLLKNKQV